MRRSNPSISALIAFSALVGFATAVQAEGQPAQNAAPAAQSDSAASGQDSNRKSSATNDQSGPSNAAPTASQQGQGDKATHSTPGRAGAEEPASHAPSQDTAVLVNGALNVPGAPADSQTIPAKFSKRNDALDRTPTMAMAVQGLSDDQKRSIVDAVRAANAPVQSTSAKPAEELPINITTQDLPASANDPALAKLKYVRVQDRILLVEPTNRIVVGELRN